ncbi:MAG: nucleotide exchange factor GrpE [Erysipelotrichaceae bacterium]|nr:nucleotide exchange factor GrpE [Erysipelotrichaceae bacterium]
MRTSLSYYQRCRENSMFLVSQTQFISQMKALADIIHKEIQELNQCSLFDQIIEEIKTTNHDYSHVKAWDKVYFADAFIIVSIIDWQNGGLKKLHNKQYAYFYEVIYKNFNPQSKETYQELSHKIMRELENYSAYITKRAQKSHRSYNDSVTSSISRGQKIKINDKNEDSTHSSQQKEDKSHQTSQNDQNVQQVPPVTQVIEKRILMSEEDVAKIVDERTQLRINSANNVKEFNERFVQLDDDILKIQSSATEVVNQVINFKQELTNNYILQFASSLIDLYDMIADSYDYHHKNIEMTDDQNYRNAIFNYETFLEEIIDKLSYLGVTTIISEPGDSLNGSYHQVVNTQSFSSRAIVSKSVRAGFMYKDRMLRKERIEVK